MNEPQRWRYSLSELQAQPTLAVSQADDLKIEVGDTRVWLCRCGVADGMPYDNMVTVEKLASSGRWITIAQYRAK